jgi:molecular chaperone GrpE|tara:strand:+ start:7664 stop:8152 length:489 start_codon:yes stop_codon:yes gene_type:complete
MSPKTTKLTLKSLKKQIGDKDKEIEDYKSRIKYLQADFENFEKRISLEKENLIISSREPLILKIIDIYENFDRALTEGSKGSKGALLKGVEMVVNQLKEILDNEGVIKIKCLGDKFDPRRHDALIKEQTKDVEEGIILDEIQSGYLLKDKVIRYSKVKVSKR